MADRYIVINGRPAFSVPRTNWGQGWKAGPATTNPDPNADTAAPLQPRFDPTLLARIPPDVLAAERALSGWFAEQGIREWKLGDCQARVD